MRGALIIALAALASTSASAEWWNLTKQGCIVDPKYPSPAYVYEQTKSFGWSPRIEDRGTDGVVIRFYDSETGPQAWLYFRTLQDCQAFEEYKKHELDGYR